MRNEVEAFLMGSTNIHSNKTGKDFVKINLIIEGEFVGFFQAATRKARSPLGLWRRMPAAALQPV